MFNWLRRKKNVTPSLTLEQIQAREQTRYELRTLDEERRAADLRIMLKKKQLEELEIDADIADLEDELGMGNEPNQSPDAIFASILQEAYTANKKPQAQTPPTFQNTSQPSVSLPYSHLEAVISQVPAEHIAISRTLSDCSLGGFIREKFPTAYA